MSKGRRVQWLDVSNLMSCIRQQRLIELLKFDNLKNNKNTFILIIFTLYNIKHLKKRIQFLFKK